MYRLFLSKPRNDASANKKIVFVFLLLWLVTFIIYLPTAEAGKIGDYYLECASRLYAPTTFKDYMLAPWGDSLYYFTLLVMLSYYKIFGISAWAWHILAVSMHAANATFLYLILYRIAFSSGIKYTTFTAAGSALLYCISPYNTEVIVNDQCFHYILGFFLALLILLCTQSFIYTLKARYAWGAVTLFIISCFCIEVFYLTLFFTFTMAWYYYSVLKFDKKVFNKVILYIIIPEFISFLVYFLLLYKITGHIFAHRVNNKIDDFGFYFLSNSPKNLFHAVFLGRFFPQVFRNAVSGFFDSKTGMGLFGGALILFCVFLAARFKKLGIPAKFAVLLFVWVCLCLALIATSFFPGPGYVTYDRYLYFMLPFLFALIFLLASRTRHLFIGATIMAGYSLTNLFLVIKMNNYWRQSSIVVNNLMKTFPVKNDGKITLLLDLPESLDGVLMIGSKPMHFFDAASIFKMDYNYEHDTKITDPVGDIASFNMADTADGAHVRVVNDSVVTVTLNQKSSSWWQYYKTATGTDNSFYRLDMTDTNHYYQLTLKQPASKYLLLYTVGEHWKTVDWGKKNVDQY